MERAASQGLICFSSPFDESAVDFLETLNAPAYKIASFECIDLPLIRKAASTGKPLIISTGMATLPEIGEAVETARSAGCKDLVLLKCTSTYPATPQNSHVRTIAHLRDLFGCEVGLSDHTMGIGAAVVAVAFGATVIEKHFTLSRADGGVDAAFSLEPHELTALVIETERAWQAIGEIRYGPTQAEEKARLRRRSLYIAEDLQPGDILTPRNLRRIRPGLGLAPRFYDTLLGVRVTKAVRAGTPMSWDLVLA
jgi:N-acetylneuraminate synthase